jgi:tRNA(Leu) C34 or U34 (ribose-2'-O)-methylase TrmL
VQRRFARIALMDTGGRPIASEGFAAVECLMFGNEARGASPGMKTLAGKDVYSVPGAVPSGRASDRAVESLNLATAVAVCAYETTRTAAAR